MHKLSLGSLGPSYGRQDHSNAVGMNQLQNVIPESPNFAKWRRYMDGHKTQKERNDVLRLKKRRMLICDLILHKVLGSHALLNAWSDVDFGPNKNNILDATSTDPMHTIEEGLIPMILEVFFGLMSPAALKEIDDYVESLFGPGRNQTREKENYPRVTFRHGYTKLTNLSSSERLGQLFLLSIILQSKKGQDLLLHRFRASFDSEREERQSRSRKRTKSSPGSNNLTPTTPASTAIDNDNEPELGRGTDDDDDGEEANVYHLEEDTCNYPDEEVTLVKLDWPEVKDYLDVIGLQYVHKDLEPQLPQHHKQ
ncbi:unnamed protein product [Cylindrotheca closterium]|uniref:Uncharacterized protein n=1 Tax=Cylindrotheca closterium TaxID=2856 RepID=A0AAD2FC14_9STRA|nr:unnamed protein product [Cylindrotheca closterium]